MPRYVSKGGEWFPANERVSLKNNSDKPIENPSTSEKYKDEIVEPKQDFIYEGPDRAALFEMFKEKVDKFGMKFIYDPDLVVRVKQLGFKDVKEYAKIMGYDSKETKEEFQDKLSKINLHDLPKKVKAIKELGGGKDFAGQGLDKYGGFGEPPEK